MPVLVALLIALNAVLSLVTIIAIYREGGILKRLRATPLRPHTILTAHVLAKLLFTAADAPADAARRRAQRIPRCSMGACSGSCGALFISTVSLLSIGFLIASIVPTARFAQPIGEPAALPDAPGVRALHARRALPPVMRAVSHVVPLTYAVSLLRGAWLGEPWSAHLGDIARARAGVRRVHRAVRAGVPVGVPGRFGWRHSCFTVRAAALPALRAARQPSIMEVTDGFAR